MMTLLDAETGDEPRVVPVWVQHSVRVRDGRVVLVRGESDQTYLFNKGYTSVPRRDGPLAYGKAATHWELFGFERYKENTAYVGFGLWRGRSAVTGGTNFVAVPLWAVLAVTLVCPAISLRRAVRFAKRRRYAGVKCACGYDLRASPDSCPECGTIPRASAHAAAP
jgi:hypothetical protein